MLQKNVWIIYPPGYGGTFINWAINISDADQSQLTINDPINKTNSEKLGGKGTSHLHVKIPTHQSIRSHMHWILLNKFQKNHVYSVNGTWQSTIPDIRQFDSTGVFIIIHNNNDFLQSSLGRINAIIKWPTYFYGLLWKEYENGPKHIHETFDPYDCAKDKIFRNYLVWNPLYFNDQSPVNLQELKKQVDSEIRWYRARNEKQPHEVNEQYYLTDSSYLNRIYEIDIATIFSNSFSKWFDNFLEKSEISNSFNTDKVESILPDFINSQENLQWFQSINYWKMTGKVDEYLTSHTAIEAEFIRYIHHLIPESYESDWDLWTPQHFSDQYFGKIKFK